MDQTPLYKRIIGGQLLVLRLISVATIISIFYLLTKGMYDYAVLLTILLTPFLLTSFTEITFYYEGLNIVRHSLLGIIKNNYDINKDNFISMTIDQEIIELHETEPSFNLKSDVIKFTYLDKFKGEQTLKIKLKNNEYQLVLETFKT